MNQTNLQRLTYSESSILRASDISKVIAISSLSALRMKTNTRRSKSTKMTGSSTATQGAAAITSPKPSLVFASTPAGQRNHFHDLYEQQKRSQK